MSDKDKVAGRPDAEAWRKVAELAERARREGWTPEQARRALAALAGENAEMPASDETDKPAA